MNARRINRSLVASLLVVLTLAAGLAPTTAAQGQPGSAWAVQFFDSMAGEAPDDWLSADSVLHTPSGDYIGGASLNDFRTDLEASFSNLLFSPRYVAQAGDMVIASFTLAAINTGSYEGLPVNCAGIAVPGVIMLHLGDRSTNSSVAEMVVEQWISYDTDLIASQIDAFNQIDASVRPGCA